MLEVCVDDIDGFRQALAGGADRIELCSALALGGLTPSAALISTAVGAAIPVHVLVRPRAGDFMYDAGEAELIGADIGAAVAAGAAGVVIGASRSDAQLDTALLERLVRVAHEAAERRGRAVALTLHRAFDLCADLTGALEAAIGLGFGRVLTSGGAESALAGREMLATLVSQARGRIRILAAGGIGPENVADILATGVDEIHASCQTPGPPSDPKLIEFGFAGARQGRVTSGSVRALASAIATWSRSRSE
jgi:copper homeostasis protein CutC